MENLQQIELWKDVVGVEGDIPYMTAYEPETRLSDCAIVIFPGGGYSRKCEHEGKAYAEFFAKKGILSFVVEYRVAPNCFPAPLQDAQRAVQLIRYYAEKFGVDKNKIAVMGSSAGGHLSALLSTYNALVYTEEDKIAKEDFKPNAQILCYPVIDLTTHTPSMERFLGENKNLLYSVSPQLIADQATPQAFIWHTFTDQLVDVTNSLEYAKQLKMVGSSVELHVFPKGNHGMGLALGDEEERKYNSKWKACLMDWLQLIRFI